MVGAVEPVLDAAAAVELELGAVAGYGIAAADDDAAVGAGLEVVPPPQVAPPVVAAAAAVVEKTVVAGWQCMGCTQR